MIRQPVIYLIFLSIFLTDLSAQEVITGLQHDNRISGSANRLQKHFKGINASDTIELPFFDDFSGQNTFPDSSKWLDEYVFINDTYSNRQRTTGIATLDALDDRGRLYETAISTGFKADELTSVPLNLNYPPSDNIWLSFFYEPGGLSDRPEANDTLTLQFFAPEENKWYSVWQSEFSQDSTFRPVIIRIDQPVFLKRGFQFRFINYATLSSNLSDPSMIGNCDIWNIDYVFLDRNRNEGDTLFHDVAFRLPLRSALNTHESMPWKQFRKVYLQEMGSAITINYRNNDDLVRNITRDFVIWDVYKNVPAHIFSAGATNIEPLSNVTYDANLVYTFNTDNQDSALFRITASLKTDEFDPKQNDTIVYYQKFSDYFAFDDGSAEAGYGINGLGSRNAMAAYRFTSFMQDTLRAIRICFNDSYMDNNKRAFDLMVWDDDNGIPGNVLYSMEEVMVEQGENINGYYTYVLPEGVLVENTFYVGWKQRSETFLNAGFDINTPHLGKQFFWTNGVWQESQVQGSIMIRPATGEIPIVTGIENEVTPETNIKKFRIWPNPAGDYLNIETPELRPGELVYITIIDMNGYEMMKIPYSERIDISRLRKGAYTVIMTLNGVPHGYSRLIKIR